MSQKRNKIIVLIVFLVAISFITLIIKNYSSKVSPKIVTGEIEGVVSGISYDAKIFDTIALTNVPLQLIDQDAPKSIFNTTTNNSGTFVFSNIPSGSNYWLEIDSSTEPASYYFPYKGRVALPYGQKTIFYPIKLVLNEKGQRDYQRQQALVLYEDLLESYKKDYGHYPITLGDEQNVNINPHFISLLEPYLKKANMEAKNLLDPIPERVFHYRSGGVHYWLLAYPEIVFDVPLFDKKENAYLIHQ